MNAEQIKILSTMKQLIKFGKRRFQIRPDRDYIQDLLEIGIFRRSIESNIIFK